MQIRTYLMLGVMSLAARPACAELALEVRQLTFGPKHHFFGYIGHAGNIPWNKSGRYVVALETDSQDRMPRANDAARIILLDTENDYAIRVVDDTCAWNPQQGTMLNWNPEAPETQFFFNDRDRKSGKVFCVLFDLATGPSGQRVREYRFEDTPVGNSGVSQQGGWFAAMNYGRLAGLRPVTGYSEAFDWTGDERHPTDDGVFRVDIKTGEKRLLVSFQQLAEALRPLRPDVDEKALFINHTLCNPEADRIFCYVRGNFSDRKHRIDQGFVIRPDGSGLTLMKKHLGGHPEWNVGHRIIGNMDGYQAIYDVERQSGVSQLANKKVFPVPDGDIALSPNRAWLVNGYRQRSTNYYTFFHLADATWQRSQGFKVRGWERGDLRCDPAPCWNRNSREIIFPAIGKDGTRQLFRIRLTEKQPG
ncbi:MAG: hypothetical protein WD468_08360 [Pirellulales bacterium]